MNRRGVNPPLLFIYTAVEIEVTELSLFKKFNSDKNKECDTERAERYEKYYNPDLNAILSTASLIISFVAIIVGYFCDSQGQAYRIFIGGAVILMFLVFFVSSKVLEKVIIDDKKPCELLFLRKFSEDMTPFAFLVTALGMLYTGGMTAEEKADDAIIFCGVMFLILVLIIAVLVIEYKRYGFNSHDR